MDKYTVDLDKILNDFEYTELTDHTVVVDNNSKIFNIPQENNKIDHGGDVVVSNTSSFHNNPSVKHSITNVFRSLNDYISTEINEKCNVSSGIGMKTTDGGAGITNEGAEVHTSILSESGDSSIPRRDSLVSTATYSEVGLERRRGSEFMRDSKNSSVEVSKNSSMEVFVGSSSNSEDYGEAVGEEFYDSVTVLSTNNEQQENSEQVTEENQNPEQNVSINKSFETKEDITKLIEAQPQMENNDITINCDTKNITSEIIIVDNTLQDYVDNDNKTNNISSTNDIEIPASQLLYSSEETNNHIPPPQNQSSINKAASLNPVEPSSGASLNENDINNSKIEESILDNNNTKFSIDNNEDRIEDADSAEYVVSREIICDGQKTDYPNNIEEEEKSAEEIHVDIKNESLGASYHPTNENKVKAKIRFEDCLDNMTDSDLNKYLEELEEEYESQRKSFEEDDGEEINKEDKFEEHLVRKDIEYNPVVTQKEQLVREVKVPEIESNTAKEDRQFGENCREIKSSRIVEAKDLKNEDNISRYTDNPTQIEANSQSIKVEMEEANRNSIARIEGNKKEDSTAPLSEQNNQVSVAIVEKHEHILQREDEGMVSRIADGQLIEENSVTNVKINVIEGSTAASESGEESEETRDEILEITLEKVQSKYKAEDSIEDEEKMIPRPSKLDLAAAPSEIKKPIDLIGEPGSTPYNNVYIVKELPEQNKTRPPQEAPTSTATAAANTLEIESENSSCTSPTFSNASTETVSSTTESSDIPPDDAIVPVKPTKRDSEDSNATLQAAGDGGATAAMEGDHAEGVVTSQSNDNNNVEGAGNTEKVDGEDRGLLEEGAVGSTVREAGDGAGAVAVSMDTDVKSSLSIWLGRQAPVWIPDADALNCMHCDMKFTVIKRRHHCRACGLVLCSKCTNFKYKLEYLDAEARVCMKCYYDMLTRDAQETAEGDASSGDSPSDGTRDETGNSTQQRQRNHTPNPNNPLEYCSTVPPLQQIQGSATPPAVLVPVGVLKRKGSNKMKSNKSVMFCDGIRPGSDLTQLDQDFNYSDNKYNKRPVSEKIISGNITITTPSTTTTTPKVNKNNCPALNPDTNSFIPSSDNNLPPTITINKTDIVYTDCANNANVVEMLKNETLTFAIQKNLFVHVGIINMDCCINKTAWCFTTEGLINVGQDEVVIILELIEDESLVPKDIFTHINLLYADAVKGSSVKEMGLSLHNTSNFLDSKNHAGFVFIKPTFQCLQNIIKPKETYLIGILIHRWETPWAKLFPLRLVLRLGAEYRYYPSPIISSRHRDSVFVEIGHTIINLLADFRNYSYTLPQIRGLTIHMEDKNTTVMIPSNRYDQVIKSMKNSSDHILAFAGNFSTLADSHLVCIQDTHSTDNSYSTHAINIHNKPRKVTGASFIVFNGALKSSSGLTAKSSIVEDGLMIQIPPERMVQIRDSLRNMKNHVIQCGCINAATDETVNIVWGEPDSNFNVGVVSPIDGQSMSGVPSIRVHNGKDFVANSGNRLIRWTEVFIIQNGEETSRNQDPVDISKVSESIAKATCQALVKYLDLLVSNNFHKIGIRTTLHVENVSYSAGGNLVKLPPIYMKSLDNELIPVLHRITSNNLGENIIVLELIFRVLNV